MKKVHWKAMRWLDNVENDLKKMCVRGWRKTAWDRDAWKLIPKETRIQHGPRSQWKRKKNWSHCAVKKTLQKCTRSASTATGQTTAVNICKINTKRVKFQSSVNLLPHQCHAF